MWALAEASGLDAAAITAGVSSVTSLGFAVWFAWYTTVYTLPGQQKLHAEQMDKRELAHAEQLDKKDVVHATTIKTLVDELKSERMDFDRWRMGGGK